MHNPSAPPIRPPDEPAKSLYVAGHGTLCVLTLILVSLLEGCAQTPKKTEDPILGAKPPPVEPIPGAQKTSFNTSPGVLPMQPNNSVTSTAALANNALPGSRPLTLGEPGSTSMETGWQRNGASGPQGSPVSLGSGSGSPKVVPIPRSDSSTQPNLLTTGAWTSPDANNASLASLQAQLKSRGVTSEKQEPVAEGVRFSCLAPNPNQSGQLRYYEVTARDYPTAVQAVLGQIGR